MELRKLAGDERAFTESGSGWEKWAGVGEAGAPSLSSEETERRTGAESVDPGVGTPASQLHLPLPQLCGLGQVT